MKLGQLLEGMSTYELIGDPELEIEGLAYDSRQVKPGYLFVALKGHELDGHDYIPDALENGAIAVVAEELEGLQEDVPKAHVPNSREALSKIAIQFYRHPFKNLNLVGITGTNGKTTTSYLLESILSAAGARPGIIGTNNYRFLDKTYPASVTTPESLDLMGFMREMADGGVTDVILEVSSHALDQKRTEDCPFRVAIFTNLSRDHLDYHNTMEEYFKAKSLLFRDLRKHQRGDEPIAVINTDDPKGEELVPLTEAQVVTYGLGKGCDVSADSVFVDRNGLKAKVITPLGERHLRSSLMGEINLYNILAASAAAISLNINLDEVVEGIERLKVVPGRMELVENKGGFTVVVDYAHTPDALLKTLNTLRPLVHGRLITVFGCGGDRDKGKRPEMGLVAGEKSDLVFITSDNPRSEDPLSIIAQIEKGTQKSGLKRLKWATYNHDTDSGYFVEMERREAIHKAVAIAHEKDLVLIAGKGHEDYQIVGSEKKYFDDRREAFLAASELRH